MAARDPTECERKVNKYEDEQISKECSSKEKILTGEEKFLLAAHIELEKFCLDHDD